MSPAPEVPAPPPQILRLASVDSTQAVAFELAARGAPDGSVVVADVQTAGRGRRGRRWLAEPGEALLASILLRPRLPVARLGALSLTTAVAVVETVQRVSSLRPRVKWPNDVRVDGRKLAGVLLESRLDSGGGAPVVVIGIGLNLRQRRFPEALADVATSIALECGGAPDRDAVLGVLLDRFDAWRGRLEAEGFAPVREQWLALTDTIGSVVTADGVQGVAVDLDDDGALLLETDTSSGRERRRLLAGDIHVIGR